MSHILRTWRQIQFGLEFEVALQYRRICAYAHPQQILNPGLLHIDVEVDVAPWLSLHPHHVSSSGQEGMQEMCFDRLQVGVAIRAVHNGVKFSVQRHLVPTDLHLEIRSVGLAINHDPVQSSLVCALRGEDATDALDRAQVSVMETIGTAQRGCSRLISVPGTPCSTGLDLAERLGIGQDGVEVHRLTGANGPQREGLNDKSQRHLAWLIRAHCEDGVGAVHPVHRNG